MTTIRKLISVWILALAGSLLLPLMSVAALSGTTSYNTPYTTTTTSATIAEHTSVTEADCFDETGLLNMDGYAQTLLGISQIFNAPKNVTTVYQYDAANNLDFEVSITDDQYLNSFLFWLSLVWPDLQILKKT